MRPASHMPLAEMMIFGRSSKLIALDSSPVTDRMMPGNQMGLTPRSSSAVVSSSKQTGSHCKKICVDSTASGLSI